MKTAAAGSIARLVLADLGEFRNGVNFGKGLKGSGLGLINVKDIFRDGPKVDFESLDFVDLASSRGIERYFVEEGDIFFVRSSVKRDGVGYVAYSDRQNHNAVHCGFVIRFRPDKGKADSRFLIYALRSPDARERIRNLAGGAAITNISQEALKTLALEIPPLDFQRRIADILSAYDDLIENNLRRIRILEEMARALYREWFVHFRFPGHEAVPRVASPLGQIPKEWEVRKLAGVADVNRAQINAHTAPDEVHYIDISSVSPGQIDNITTYPFAEAPGRARRIVQHGDVLWSCVRPNRRSHALLMHPGENTIASTGFAVLTATKVPFTFLYYATITDDFVAYLANNATGAAYPAVTAKTFENADLLIPPVSMLKKFGDTTIPMAEQIHAFQRKNQNLRYTRDLLLPRILSGATTLLGATR